MSVTVVVLVVAPLVLAGFFATRGQPVVARYCLAVALVGLLATWLGYETRIRRFHDADAVTSSRLDDGSRQLEIPYSRNIYLGYAALMGTIALVFLVATVDAAWSGDGERARGAYLWAPLALVFGSLPVLMATGRFARGHLRLSPDGVHQRGWTFESFLPWSGIVGAWPRYADGPVVVLVGDPDTPWQRRSFTRLWRQDRLPDVKDRGRTVPTIVIPGKFLAVDPVLVYHLLGYYLERPAARVELGTEAAVRRARAAAFE
ncbi:hypothetical protein [Amycolatopsis arida]|nr:hypothetical protein [Amycolatopsis arida]